MKKILIVIIVLVMFNATVYGQALDAFIEILKTDANTQKSTIFRKKMKLNKLEGDKFWPVYEDYEHELDKINNERIEVIRYYARNYNHLSDNESEVLAKKAFKLQIKKIKKNHLLIMEFKYP